MFSDFSGDGGWILASRHCAFSEGFGNQLPFVFVDHLARFVCSDFLHVDAVAFEDVDHLRNAGDVRGGASLEPTDAEAVFCHVQRRLVFSDSRQTTRFV